MRARSLLEGSLTPVACAAAALFLAVGSAEAALTPLAGASVTSPETGATVLVLGPSAPTLGHPDQGSGESKGEQILAGGGGVSPPNGPPPPPPPP